MLGNLGSLGGGDDEMEEEMDIEEMGGEAFFFGDEAETAAEADPDGAAAAKAAAASAFQLSPTAAARGKEEGGESGGPSDELSQWEKAREAEKTVLSNRGGKVPYQSKGGIISKTWMRHCDENRDQDSEFEMATAGGWEEEWTDRPEDDAPEGVGPAAVDSEVGGGSEWDGEVDEGAYFD